jgi:hypothetical protein
MSDYPKLFVEALKKHGNHGKWDNALYSGIKTISNTKVGSVGSDFIESLCKDLGLHCEFPQNAKGKRATQSPWDIKINGVEFELKTATEDTALHFQFNHIRYHRAYDAVLCLGVSPNDLFFGVWSKAEIATGKAGRLVSMEKGANASYKLTKSKVNLHLIAEFDGVLTQFINKFKSD